MIRLAHIFRHPIKAHGVEPLQTVDLTANATLPWDRVWAVTHEATKEDGQSQWARCVNFSRGCSAPQLMAISSTLDTATGHITLRHPDLSEITFDPDTQGAEFLNWVAPLMPADGRKSTGLTKAQSAAKGQGLTDNASPYVSLLNLSSLRALGQKLGQDLSPLRFRGNLWMEGAAPWEEFDFIGKTLRLGAAELQVEEPIERCRATEANPTTGRRDAATLSALRDGWDHSDFGVFARVIKSGPIDIGDQLEVIG